MTALYDWIKQIPPSILQLDEKPLFGKGPPFPWKQLAENLANTFQVHPLEIQAKEMQWLLPENLTSGLGSDLIPLTCTFPGLEGELTWVMSKSQVATLMQLLLTKKPEAFEIIDPDFIHGFYYFIAAQTVFLLDQIDFDPNLSASVQEKSTLPTQASFGIDVEILAQEKKLLGRALLSQELIKSWKERFADRKLGIDLNSSLAKKLQVTVQIVAGKTTLNQEELASLKVGDFLLLDSCTLDLESDKGRVLLTLHELPLFRAKLKQGSLKILEYPLTLEAEAPMNHNEDEDFEEFGGESDFEEFEEEPTAEHEESEEEIPPPIQPKPKEAKEPIAEGKKGGIEVSELPVHIHVELGRLQMSIQKLMELQPGNMLELNIRPEDGVDLVVNGRRIAKGELLRIGETLGVRILDIG